MTNKPQAESTESIEEKTLKELRRANRELAKRNSHSQTFVRGIYRGLGAAVGATVVAAIILSILSFGVDKIGWDIPLLDSLKDQVQLKETQAN